VNLEQSTAFLKALGAQGSQLKSDGKWLRCSCPLARWTHKNHKDSNPSFALSLDETEQPYFNCFSCLSGSAATLLQTLELYASQTPEYTAHLDFKTAHEILDGAELVLATLPGYGEKPNEHKPVIAWPQAWLDSFFHADKVELAREYLYSSKDHVNMFGQKGRDFPPELITRFDVRYDHSRAMVVFPYRTADGVLAGMRGRSITEKRHFDYTWETVNNAHSVWFNEQALNLPGWVIVCEGQMDVMRVVQGGHAKVVGNLTAKPTDIKLGKLLHAWGTLLIPDNDAAGEISVARYREFHKKHNQPFRVLNLPAGIKDADDGHYQWLADRIDESLN